MYSERLIACSYVSEIESNYSSDIESFYILEYYLYSDSSDNEKERLYGIVIKQTGTALSGNKTKIFLKEAEAIHLIQSYAKNFVFPCSLNDLIADYIYTTEMTN